MSRTVLSYTLAGSLALLVLFAAVGPQREQCLLRAVDASGASLANAHIVITDAAHHVVCRAQLDGDGCLDVQALGKGIHWVDGTVSVHPLGESARWGRLRDVRQGGELVFERGRVVHGQVLGPQQPASLSVQWHDTWAPSEPVASTDSTGRYELWLPEGFEHGMMIAETVDCVARVPITDNASAPPAHLRSVPVIRIMFPELIWAETKELARYWTLHLYEKSSNAPASCSAYQGTVLEEQREDVKGVLDARRGMRCHPRTGSNYRVVLSDSVRRIVLADSWDASPGITTFHVPLGSSVIEDDAWSFAVRPSPDPTTLVPGLIGVKIGRAHV